MNKNTWGHAFHHFNSFHAFNLFGHIGGGEQKMAHFSALVDNKK